jgi:hypothetical protein
LRNVRWGLVLAVAALPIALSAWQQAGGPAQAPRAAILGRVVDAQTGQPLPGVAVGLVSSAPLPPGAPGPRPPSFTATTDEKGRFLFRGVPGSTYQVSARVGANGYNANGFLVTGTGFLIGAYLDGGYGQRRPNGAPQPFILKDGEQIPDMVIRLWKAAVVSGRVFDEAGDPLVRQVVGIVQVSGSGTLLNGPTMRTDDRGAFRFSGLVPGQYVLFVPQTQVSVPVALADDVVNGPPDPTQQQRFNAASAPSVRNGGLRVGDSLLATVPDSARFGPATPVSNSLAPVRRGDALFAYATTFHPSATALPDAERIRLAAGEERENVDVRLQPVAATRVSGTVVDSAGPVPGMGVRLMPADQGADASILEAALTVTDPRGAFEFPVVPAGRYTVLVWRAGGPPGFKPGDIPSRPADAPGAWAMQPVTVAGRPVERVTVTMQPAVTATGRVVFSGSSDRPAAERLRSGFMVTIWQARSLFRIPEGSSGSLIDPVSGAITVRSLSPPGKYFVGPPGMPAPWTLESITHAGRDVTDAALTVGDADVSDIVITYTDRPAHVSGSVAGVSGADHGVSVLMFPANRSRWDDARLSRRTFRLLRPGQDGAFAVPAALPGDYLLAAIRDDAASDEWDESFLSRLAAVATPVRVAPAQQATVTLRVSAIK